MSIQQADIDAVVGAFVEDLVDLVRRAALDAARHALGAEAEEARPTRSAAAPGRRAVTRAAYADDIEEEAEPKVKAQPAPLLGRKLDPRRPGRLIVIPSSESQAQAAPPPPAPAPLPVPRRFEPKKPRKRTVRAAATPEPTPAAPAEPIPARQWVVVRRPARDRAANETNATSGNGSAASNGAEQVNGAEQINGAAEQVHGAEQMNGAAEQASAAEAENTAQPAQMEMNGEATQSV